jgi:hypothetical protein
LQSQAKLPHIVKATGDLCLLLGFAQGWEQHGRKNGNDRNHHQQFNQGEGARENAGIFFEAFHRVLDKRVKKDYLPLPIQSCGFWSFIFDFLDF